MTGAGRVLVDVVVDHHVVRVEVDLVDRQIVVDVQLDVVIQVDRNLVEVLEVLLEVLPSPPRRR